MLESLSRVYPEFVSEWDDGRDIESVSAGSGYRARWKCQKGHIFYSTVSNRVYNRRGCPQCSGRIATVGVNDLASNYPAIAAEWHPDNPKSATEYTSYSNKKVKWICENGHAWMANIYQRTARGTGCAECSGKKYSAAEIRLLCSLSRYSPVLSQQSIDGLEADVLLPELNLVFEYDGRRWHEESVERDTKKSLALLGHGLKLVRLRENDLFHLDLEHENFHQFTFAWTSSQDQVNWEVDRIMADLGYGLRPA